MKFLDNKLFANFYQVSMTFVSFDEKDEIMSKNKIDPDARNDFYNTICNIFWLYLFQQLERNLNLYNFI